MRIVKNFFYVLLCINIGLIFWIGSGLERDLITLEASTVPFFLIIFSSLVYVLIIDVIERMESENGSEENH